jgi:hypothetical protein
MRVYEIAKKAGLPNHVLFKKIRALGIEVDNHMSSLDADDVARIMRSLDVEHRQTSPVPPVERRKTLSVPSGVVIRRRSPEPASPPATGGAQPANVNVDAVKPSLVTTPENAEHGGCAVGSGAADG